MIDGPLYRETYARLAEWSRAAEAHDLREAATIDGDASLARCLEVSNFLLRWAPPPNRSQLMAMDQERRTYEANVRSLEAWRARGKP